MKSWFSSAWVVVLMASALIVMTGCPRSASVQIGGQPSPTVVTGPPPSPGPPPHAPAYGYRAKHQYYYYPAVNVYYEPARQAYFYLSDGAWRVSVSLPTSLKVQLGDHVSLDLDTDQPYIYNQQHKQKYPPGKVKAKPKKIKK